MQQDANYNVTALLNDDGDMVERYTYDPFGTVTVHDVGYENQMDSTCAWMNTFQGLRHDVAVGLNFTHTRPYRSSLGRPITADPLGLAPDLNSYRWEKNTPTIFVDPSGLELEDTLVDVQEVWLRELAQILGRDATASEVELGDSGCIGLARLALGLTKRNDRHVLKAAAAVYRFCSFPSKSDIKELIKSEGGKLRCPPGSEPRVFMVQFHGYIPDYPLGEKSINTLFSSGNSAVAINKLSIDLFGERVPKVQGIPFDFLTYYNFDGKTIDGVKGDGRDFWLHMNQNRLPVDATSVQKAAHGHTYIKRSCFEDVEDQLDAYFNEYVVCLICGPPNVVYRREGPGPKASAHKWEGCEGWRERPRSDTPRGEQGSFVA